MTTRTGRILVVDDDAGVLTAAKLLLKRHFAVVQTESDPARLPALLDGSFDVVLLDMNFAIGSDNGADGFRWLERILQIDPGIVVNPLQLKRTIEGGALMGLSHALYEEMTFDESGVTSRDWRTYPILTMEDVPEVKVVILNRPEVGAYGGGSEAANALAVSAIAAAFLDATGKPARRLPLKPAYVQAVLKA